MVDGEEDGKEDGEEDGEEEGHGQAGVRFSPRTTQIYDTIDSSCGFLDNNVSARTASDMKKRYLSKRRRGLASPFDD